MGAWLLVVEENPQEREALAELLEVSGLEITACANVEEARAAMERHGRPEFIVANLAMPEASGVGFIEGIRRTPGFETVPVAFLSDTDPSVGADIADPIVKKPVDAEYLLGLIADQCSQLKSRGAL